MGSTVDILKTFFNLLGKKHVKHFKVLEKIKLYSSRKLFESCMSHISLDQYCTNRYYRGNSQKKFKIDCFKILK